MKPKRQDETREQLKQRIHDLECSAIRHCYTWDEVMKRLTEDIYDRPEYKALAFYRQAYLRGCIDSMFRRFWDMCITKHYLAGQLIVGSEVPAGKWCEVKYTGQFWPNGKVYIVA